MLRSRALRPWVALLSMLVLLSVAGCGGSADAPKPATPAPSKEAAKPAAPAPTPAAVKPAAQAPGAPKAAPAGKPRELVVKGYGGEYEPLIMQTVIKPFEQKFNVKITYDATGSAAQGYAKVRATQGDPGWDVGILTAQEAVQGRKENLLLPITEEKVPNLKAVYPELRQYVGTHGAPHEVQVMGLVYNPKYVKEPVDSWNVLWDPAYKGRVLMFEPANLMGVFALIQAARLDGGGMDNIEPGFKRFEQLKPQLRTFLQSSSDAIPPFQKEEVWLMPYWDGRGHYYIKQGLPMKMVIPKEGSIGLINALVVPKGAKNPEVAMEFINFWLEKDIQRQWALAYTVGPSRGDVDLPKEHAQYHVVNPEQLKNLMLPDMEALARVRPQWSERIKKILAN